ncbi:MAG: cell division protein FtsK [Rhodospirillaceae bacterium]|nr:cell division protein FtsK [Rhodospirillaceae bacterium]
MATRSAASRRAPLLPQAVAEFLRRRAVEAAGLAVLALAVALLVAVATFDSADPSFNRATDAAPSNALGVVGAYLADVALQSIGIGSLFLVPLLLFWGVRLLQHEGLAWPIVRIALLPPTVMAVAAGSSAFPIPAAWPVASGLGGFVGDFLLGRAISGAMAVGAPPWGTITAVGLIAVALYLVTLGVTPRQWAALAGRAARSAGWVASQGRRLAGLAQFERTKPEPDVPQQKGRAQRTEPQITKPKKARPAAKEPVKEKDEAPAPRKQTPVLPASTAPSGRREVEERQGALDLDPDGSYRLPSLGLLTAPARNEQQAVDEAALDQNARLLESVLEDFGVKGSILRVQRGPVVTRYDLEPAPGTRSARVVALADDIARSMSAVSARVAVIPGENAIGIELPNVNRETVLLRELLGSEAYERTASQLALVLGKDISGIPIVVDLARMPHLLVAGTTGSGKSVAINAMILSLLYRLPPDLCKFLMIDPKMLELSIYDGIPHLLHPVVTDPHKAVVALKWAVKEMNDRYRLMSQLSVRNIAGYNKRIADARAAGETLSRTVQTGYDPETGKPLYTEQELEMEPLPFIVVIVDEMADLMLVAGKDIEICVQSLAQKARAAGIHLILATQRPSVDVITGTIKANLPTRISFQVTSKIDSRTILGEQGAEQLLGLGDMLYRATGGQLNRVHGPFVSDAEVEEVANFVRSQGTPAYIEAITEEEDGGADFDSGRGDSGDALYDQAVALVCRERKASTSFVQRHLQIGYNRAARIIEQMEAEGVVSAANHVGKREVLARDVDAFE